MPTYTLVKKNRKRPTAPYYVRKRVDGKIVDVNLHTSDPKLAEAELMRVKLAETELDGRGDPLDALLVRRKQASEAVSRPGGVLDAWAQEMAVQGLRGQSIEKYTRAARLLLTGISISELTVEKVKTILARTANLKNNTRRAYVNALASLFRHLNRDDLVKALPKVKTEQTDRVWWTAFQMERIVNTVRSDTAEHTLEYRDYFSVMAAIGSRQSETAALRWCDLKDGVVTFRGETTKSRKERRVPLPYDVWASIEVRRPEEHPLNGAHDTSPIFPYVSRANQATRYNVLARALRKLKLKGGLHTFRHSVSMILYKRCSDIKAVSQILGYSPQVALTYYQNSRSVEELRSIIDRG